MNTVKAVAARTNMAVTYTNDDPGPRSGTANISAKKMGSVSPPAGR